MNTSETDRRHDIALFRYGVIVDLLQPPAGSKGLYALIEAKAALEYTIPWSTHKRVEGETICGWLKAYRDGGFDALLPKERADRGHPVRCHPT